MAHSQKDKARLLARVKRIAGQVAAIEKALESDAECSVVLHRVAAARGAMNGLVSQLLEEHAREHVGHPGLTPAERAKGLEELLAVFKQYKG
ncbi:MAG: metal/formaldehyde-sensitive transcriptional repressor [Beijerinckiaceae bacterium]|nr:metal/formaldehyde-sensitive transcriptional repressor [Beijerinckiaceae bacterium]